MNPPSTDQTRAIHAAYRKTWTRLSSPVYLDMARKRFNANMLPPNGHGCVPMKYKRNRDGYVLFALCGKATLAHIARWRLFVGDIPDGLEVCHRCDNPWCVNIDHLFLATHKENMEDASRKGRMGHPAINRKIPDNQVPHIVQSVLVYGQEPIQLAKYFGVTASCIHRL
jgi:hypothetical protein